MPIRPAFAIPFALILTLAACDPAGPLPAGGTGPASGSASAPGALMPVRGPVPEVVMNAVPPGTPQSDIRVREGCFFYRQGEGFLPVPVINNIELFCYTQPDAAPAPIPAPALATPAPSDGPEAAPPTRPSAPAPTPTPTPTPSPEAS